MNIKDFYKKSENTILSFAVVVLFGLFVSLRYELIYELNDDAVIRNLLSGSYTGSPTAMNNQMMFVLSAVLSFLYRIIPAVQWFDIFILLCQYICVFMILHRLLGFADRTSGKIGICAVYLAFMFAFLLNHFVLPTYTVASGMLAVTAIFLFITEKDNDNLFKKNVLSIAFAVLALCIRSEMMFMLMPFVCVAGFYRWIKEEKIFKAENFKKYFGVFGTIVILMSAVLITDSIAYSSEGWKDFRSFFDARTTVYDYTDIPLYKDNEEFYKNEDISFEQFLLFRSYNFSLDEDIDSEMMSTVAEYAQKTGVDLREKINIALGAYRIQVTDRIGTPYHTLAVLGYIMLLLCLKANNKIRILVMGCLMFFTRSVIWLYLWGQGRVIERITHPLYWAEFIVLFAVFVYENFSDKSKRTNKRIAAAAALSLAVCVISANQEIPQLTSDYNMELSKAQQHEAVQKYCLDRKDNFYLAATYSIGVLPEIVFDGCEEPENLDTLGSWIAKSPAHKEKLTNNGIEQIDMALLNNENVYIIQNQGYISYDTDRPFQWLTDYYAAEGYTVKAVKTDTIVDDIEVYKIQEIKGE